MKRWLRRYLFRLWMRLLDERDMDPWQPGDCPACSGTGMSNCGACAGSGWQDGRAR